MEEQYIDLIQKLQNCKGIGALIETMQTNINIIDEGFIFFLDTKIKNAEGEKNQKLVGSLSYIKEVMSVLSQGNSQENVNEEESGRPWWKWW